MTATFWIAGTPAPFATRGERPWKARIAKTLGEVPQPGAGLKLDFRLPCEGVWPRKTDLDNLCEPVFSTVINRLGWFGGRRSNLRFFWASKSFEQRTGLDLRVLDSGPPAEPVPMDGVIFRDVYEGPMPTRATDPNIPAWLSPKLVRDDRLQARSLGICLRFGGTTTNIGDVAGRVKAIIDCLHPLIGGSAKAPDDWKVDTLMVEKGLSHIGVEITVFS